MNVFNNSNHIIEWRKSVHNKSIVATNGCFDVIHRGHIELLNKAKSLGDILVVGINSNESVKKLKGNLRPIFDETDRAYIISSIKCVDAVYIFPEITAVNFLELVQPNIWVKGGDYTEATLNASEKQAVTMNGGIMCILPIQTKISSSCILKRILE